MAETLYRYGMKITPKGNHSLQVRKPKMEIGTVMTDWSPAPEDPDNELYERISVLQTDFSVVQGEIQAKVWETDIEKATDGLYEQMNEMYSYINETINSITAEVADLTYVVEGNYSTLTAQISNLIITNSSIATRVQSIEQELGTGKNLLANTDEMNMTTPWNGYNTESRQVTVWTQTQSSGLPAGSYYVTVVPWSSSKSTTDPAFTATGFHWYRDDDILSRNMDYLVEGNTYTFSFYMQQNTSREYVVWINNCVYGQTVLSSNFTIYNDGPTNENFDRDYIIIPTGSSSSWLRVSITFRLDSMTDFRLGVLYGEKDGSGIPTTYFCGLMLNAGEEAEEWDDGEYTETFVTKELLYSEVEQLNDSITSTVARFESDIDGINAAQNIFLHTGNGDGNVGAPYAGNSSESQLLSNYALISNFSSDLPAASVTLFATPNSVMTSGSLNYCGFHWTADNNILLDNADKLVEGNTYTFSFYVTSATADTLYLYFRYMVYGQTVLNCSLETYSDTSSYYLQEYGKINLSGNTNDWTRIWVTFRLDNKTNFRIGPAYGYETAGNYFAETIFCGFMLNEGDAVANWDDGENGRFATTSYVYSQVQQLADSITATVADLSNELYAQIQILDNSITSIVADVQADVESQIQQLAGSITLSVSSATNGSASIVMTVDGQTAGSGSILSSGVRTAFKNDNTAITISAGTVTFNSNTFIVNSTYFSVTATGVITATSGKIGGWTIGSNALYSGPSSISDETTQGIILYSGTSGGLRTNYNSHSALLRYGYLVFDRNSSEVAYISGNSYYTSTGQYGLRLAGYGIVAMMTPYLMSCTQYYAHDADATGHIGFTGSYDVVNSITSGSNGSISWTYSKMYFANGIFYG